MRISDAKRIAREKRNLTRVKLAKAVRVTSGRISNWENGWAIPPAQRVDELESTLGVQLPKDVGEWLRETINEKGLQVRSFSEESAYSLGYVYNIMNGHAENVSDAALIEFARVLDVEVPRTQFEDEETEIGQSQQDTIGELGDFDLHNLSEVDGVLGVYVLWDVKNCPTYVGQG